MTKCCKEAGSLLIRSFRRGVAGELSATTLSSRAVRLLSHLLNSTAESSARYIHLPRSDKAHRHKEADQLVDAPVGTRSHRPLPHVHLRGPVSNASPRIPPSVPF